MAKKPAPAPRNVPASRTPTGTQVTSNAADATAPDYLRGYRGPLGTEDIAPEDITIPRLKIAQSMSEEVKTGGLQEGQLFLNVSGEPLWSPGMPPLPMVIVARSKEYILWRPRKDGGGILARAKPERTPNGLRYRWDKPNQTFDVKVDGKIKVTWKTKQFIDEDGLGEWGSEIPDDEESGIAATAHHNYVVALPTKGNVVCALSLARASVKKAKDLNAAIRMRGAVPIQAGRYAISTIDEHNDLGDFKNYKISNDGWVSEQEFPVYDQLAKGFQTTGFTVDVADEPTRGSDDDEM